MTTIFLYYQLSTCSKRALTRTTKRYGHRNTYRPRMSLLQRLARENNMSIEDVRDQLLQERLELIKFD